MKNIKIVFFGTPSFVAPILEALEKNFQVVGVVTKGSLNTPEELRKLNPDLFIVAAYGKIIPQNILDIPKYGTLNIHYSLLPKYRGASPIQSAILNGDKVSGTSVIQMDEKMDHGPVLITKEIMLSDKDTFESLNTKMTQETIPLLIQIIPEYIGGKIKPVVQDDAIAEYCSIIKKEDGYFEINNPPLPEKLDKMIRAYYPWPGVWTLFRQGSRGQARIVKFLPEGIVQMEGKKPTKLEDFLRGYPDFPIKSLD